MNSSASDETAPSWALAEAWPFGGTLGGWHPTPEQQQCFQSLYTHLMAGNQHLNLTRITKPADFWEKHLWDSLAGIAPWLGQGVSPVVQSCGGGLVGVPDLPPRPRIVDIGTGGGFPGLPVAIVCPEWQVTLVDSTRKKIAFLEALVQRLGLSNVWGSCDRAETLGHSPQFRQTFDLALIRAVGSVTCCAEYALPLVRLGGTAILYRGEWSQPETQQLESALRRLGGELVQVRAMLTPLTQGQRHYLYLHKVEPTPPEYPRPIGIPARRPLGIEA